MSKLIKPEVARAEELPRNGPEVGQWYWLDEKNDEEDTRFTCVVHLGSNYVKLETPEGDRERVHTDEFETRCRLEPNPDAHINRQIGHYQRKVRTLMGRVREVTARLGVTHRGELPSGGETAALVKVSGNESFATYSSDLVKAKDETLPGLFERIEEANRQLATWMNAKVVPLKAQARGLKSVIGAIEDRIFSVELYAGLVEEIELIADGEPAELGTKVHLLQRRCYMDEECLAQYEVGGMDYRNIRSFDKWLTRSDNLERLLPFERCVVSFQVRRNRKDREAVKLSDFLRIMDEEKCDKWTFLYLRNGEKVYRMHTEIEFGPRLFPDIDKSQFDGRALRASNIWGEWCIITEDEYEERCRTFNKKKAKWKKQLDAYQAATKTPEAKAKAKELGLEEPDRRCVDVPWVSDWFSGDDPHGEWEPFSPDSVYYDDIKDQVERDIKAHNRIVLILQGLLDRSPVFHPHPPWQLWTEAGFRSALELVCDESRALTPGEQPDFDAYRKKCNASIQVGSITIGQERAWLHYEAQKENEKRGRYGDDPSWVARPFGNPGPGKLARIAKLSRKKSTATFSWHRQRQDWRSDKEGPIRTTFSCLVSDLFNVDAYKPGDFRMFFADPRTRQNYLKWAPTLLEAEEYHAGNRKVSEPVEPTPRGPSSWEGRRRYRQRKAQQALQGKAVRLVHEITTKGKDVYKVNSLWRVQGGGPNGTVQIAGIHDDGTLEQDDQGLLRWVHHVPLSDLKVDDSIPDGKKETE